MFETFLLIRSFQRRNEEYEEKDGVHPKELLKCHDEYRGYIILKVVKLINFLPYLFFPLISSRRNGIDFMVGKKRQNKNQVFLKAEAIKMQVGSSGQSSDCPESYTAKPSRMNLNDNLK